MRRRTAITRKDRKRNGRLTFLAVGSLVGDAGTITARSLVPGVTAAAVHARPMLVTLAAQAHLTHSLGGRGGAWVLDARCGKLGHG